MARTNSLEAKPEDFGPVGLLISSLISLCACRKFDRFFSFLGFDLRVRECVGANMDSTITPYKKLSSKKYKNTLISFSKGNMTWQT